MSAPSKIPPHIARELARHVKPTSNKTTTLSSQSRKNNYKNNNSNSNNNNKTMKTVVGCFAFVGVTASIPLWAMKWIGPLNEKDGALTGGQIRRGAFNNSGSRDVGKDPMWDFRTGTRKKDKDYVDLFLKDDPNDVDLGEKFLQSSTRRR
jgi:hypothetical protein